MHAIRGEYRLQSALAIAMSVEEEEEEEGVCRRPGWQRKHTSQIIAAPRR